MFTAADVDFTLSQMQYGLGIFILPSIDSGIVQTGHSGALIHHFSNMILDIKNNIGVFVSVNSNAAMVIPAVLSDSIYLAALQDIGAEPISLPSRGDINAYAVELSIEELEALAGYYTLLNGEIWRISIIDGVYNALSIDSNMELQIPFDVNFRLIPLSDGSFELSEETLGVNIRLWFEDAEDYFIIRQGIAAPAFIGFRIGINIEDILPFEGFEAFIGRYYLPHFDNPNHISILEYIEIDIDDFGIGRFFPISRNNASNPLALSGEAIELLGFEIIDGIATIAPGFFLAIGDLVLTISE
jgi:hypothetical protein